MGILLAFAPFIAFAVLDRLVGPVEGLIAGALVSATMLLRDWMSPGRTPKILEIGTVLLFGGLALYAVAGGPTQSVMGGAVMGGAVMGGSVMGVRLLVDAGLLLIVLTSIALRRPFTLQYAREQVAHEFWDDPRFIHTNYVITGVWALAFLVLVIADLILLYRPDLPPRFGIVATVLALVGAIKFTSWYPEHRRSAAGTV